MDALTAALVAALIAHAGDRTPFLAARLGDRFAGGVSALLGLALSLVGASALAGIVATAALPLLTPEAALLLLGAALLWSGIGALGRLKPPRLHARLGAFGTGLVQGGAVALGDRAPFLIFAIAARSPLPWAAALGGAIGALAVAAPTYLLGEPALRPLPWRAIRLGGGGLFLATGAILALSAIGLI